MLPSMFFSDQLFVILSRKFLEKNCLDFCIFLSQRFYKTFCLLLKFFNGSVLFSFSCSIDWYSFQNFRSALSGRKKSKVRATIKFQKSRVVLFSIEKSRTFRIWRERDIVEKIERTAPYEMVYVIFRGIQVYKNKLMYKKGHFFRFLSNFSLVNYYIILLFHQIIFE